MLFLPLPSRWCFRNELTKVFLQIFPHLLPRKRVAQDRASECDMPCAFKPCLLKINSYGRFKREHVESCFPVTRLLYLHHHNAYGYHPWQGCGLSRLWLQHRRCEYCEIFKNSYFEKHMRTATSVFKHL